MNLDPKIVPSKSPLTCFDIEQAKEFIGKECYFSDDATDFMDLDQVDWDSHFYIAVLQSILVSKEYCFTNYRGDYRFILPCEWVEEKKEPKYRPYTIKDFEEAFLKGEFEDFIIFRDKTYTNDIYTMRYNGNFKKGEFEYICLGAKNFSFEHLFENYEVANYDGDFVPFGVLEE